MGKKDLDERIYLKNPAVFADACNFALFGGADVIQPESLREADTSHVAARMNRETNEIFVPDDSQSESAVGYPVKRKKRRKGKSKAGMPLAVLGNFLRIMMPGLRRTYRIIS